jgi:hypothetical protein
MSQKDAELARCPRCPATWSVALFGRLHADLIPAKVAGLLDGGFARVLEVECPPKYDR